MEYTNTLFATLAALCAVAAFAALSSRRLATAILGGLIPGSFLGAVILTTIMYIGAVSSHDQYHDGHNDWLILFIGPIIGAIPGAVLGAAVGALRSGYRKAAGWMFALPFTLVAVCVLKSAPPAHISEVLMFDLAPILIAGWGWYLLLTAWRDTSSESTG
jgi:uncharacterized membrane protein